MRALPSNVIHNRLLGRGTFANIVFLVFTTGCPELYRFIRIMANDGTIFVSERDLIGASDTDGG